MAPQEKSSEMAIWPVLAGLRFFFAMWVLFDHTYNFGPADRAMPVFTKSGLVAVMCFLVISGFSIHHSIATRPEGYGWRRFWRIVPINTLSVAIGWFAWSVLGLSGGYGTPPNSPPWWKYVGCLLLLQSIFPVMIHFLFPAWSLSIEILYYLAGPFLAKQRKDTLILCVVAFSSFLFIAWPFIGKVYIAEPAYGITAAALAWAYLTGWLAYSNRSNHVYFITLIFAGILGFWHQAGIVDFISGLGNAVAWIATLIVVFYRIGLPISQNANVALNYLGDLSYPLYLLHYPVLFAVTSSVFKSRPDWNYGITQVAIALAVSVIAYHFVDRPLRAGSRLNAGSRTN